VTGQLRRIQPARCTRRFLEDLSKPGLGVQTCREKQRVEAEESPQEAEAGRERAEEKGRMRSGLDGLRNAHVFRKKSCAPSRKACAKQLKRRDARRRQHAKTPAGCARKRGAS
jgi:hypothetical protein